MSAKTEPFTAAMAREIAGPTAEEIADGACAHIRKAAEEKKREIIIRDGFWGGNDAYSQTELYRAACKCLKDRGFSTSLHYVESQFVDIGTKVTW